MTCVQTILLLKDIILAGAALTGSVVAVRGLNTWQRQLKGQSEYELSRRILITVFKYRDAIDLVRHPMMWANEMPSPSESEAKGMSSEKIRFYGTSKAYQARWDKVQTERTSLYADLLEAEAIWGDDLKTIFKALFDLEFELFTKIRHYLELMNPDTNEKKKEAIEKIDAKKRDIMYDDLGEESDEFKKDFLNAIKLIEQYLKPNLNHEKV